MEHPSKSRAFGEKLFPLTKPTEISLLSEKHLLLSKNNANVKCLIITPNNTIDQIVLSVNIDQTLIPESSPENFFELVAYNFKTKYNCPCYCKNIIKTSHSQNTYYSIFFESENIFGDKVCNNIVTQLINKNDIECYGNCYIALIHGLDELYDTDKKSFLVACNKQYLEKKRVHIKSKEISIREKKRYCVLY